MDWSLPIGVPVTFGGLSVAYESVSTSFHEDSVFIAIDAIEVGDDGDDRKLIITVLIDVGARNDWTWQFAVLEESETEDGGFENGEESCLGGLSIMDCWGCARPYRQ